MSRGAPLALAAVAFLATGLGFAWLVDPRIEQQAAMGLFWLAWTALGFGLAAMRSDARGPARAMTLLAVLLAFMPGLSMYRPVPWGGAVLLLVAGARAPLLRSPRGLYRLALVLLLASGAAATHPRADLALLACFGPAWLAIALALALQQAAGWPLGAAARWGGALGFVGTAALLSALLVVLLPRPPQLWNGEPGRLDLPRLLAPLLPLAQRLAPDTFPAAAPNGHDPNPNVRTPLERRPPPPSPPLRLRHEWLLAGLAAALALAGRHRHALRDAATRGAARLLAGARPLRAMRLAAQALRWRLAALGHMPRQTLREQLAGSVGLDAGARERFTRAVDLYGQARFGRVGATPALAREMLRCLVEGEALLRRTAPQGTRARPR